MLAVVVTRRRTITSQGIVGGSGFLGRAIGWQVGISVIEVCLLPTCARGLSRGRATRCALAVLPLLSCSLIGFVVAMLRVGGNRLMRERARTGMAVLWAMPMAGDRVIERGPPPRTFDAPEEPPTRDVTGTPSR